MLDIIWATVDISCCVTRKCWILSEQRGNTQLIDRLGSGDATVVIIIYTSFTLSHHHMLSLMLLLSHVLTSSWLQLLCYEHMLSLVMWVGIIIFTTFMLSPNLITCYFSCHHHFQLLSTCNRLCQHVNRWALKKRGVW